MTDWNKLGARERQYLVLQHVFKAKAWTEQRGDYTYVYFQLEGQPDPWLGTRGWQEAKKRYAPIEFKDIDAHRHIVLDGPDYPANIQDAWLVVERMREKGWGYSMFTVSPFSSMMHGCLVVFAKSVYPANYIGLDPKQSAHAPTAPEAICLAALRAVGVGV